MGAADPVSSTGIETSARVSPPATGFARFWRTLRQIFHEVVGGIFAVLALAWLQSAARAWTRDVAHWLVFLSIGVALMLAVCSWTSFRRARQLS